MRLGCRQYVCIIELAVCVKLGRQAFQTCRLAAFADGTFPFGVFAMTTEASAFDPITIGGVTVRYLIDGSAAKSMGVFELTVDPGANVPPPHSHTHNEECIYALEGLIRYSVDGVVRDLAPGQWMHTPKGSVHAFSNPHQATAKALIVLTPDLGAQYFLDVQEIVSAGGPPDRQKLIAVMSRYGLVPSAPIPAVP